ncbi:two-component response regulator ARR18-like [Aristolochia californica]|uniref:two-component response regulator ARR18-like n=1 Tax=Aristolochia californica TaxID=171875 RepID=UPI0035E293B1
MNALHAASPATVNPTTSSLYFRRVSQIAETSSCFLRSVALRWTGVLSKRRVCVYFTGSASSSPFPAMERGNTGTGYSAFRQSRPDDQLVRVLLADDDHCYITQAQRLLCSLGCKVKAFDSGKNAWHELLRRNGKFDIVMVDVYIPGMNGFELLDKIKEKWIDLPVIIISADTNPVIITRAIQQNASFYVKKSNAMDELTNIGKYVDWNRKARQIYIEETNFFSRGMDEWHGNFFTSRNEKSCKKKVSTMERKPHLDWKAALRNQFFCAIDQLGFESKMTHLRFAVSGLFIKSNYTLGIIPTSLLVVMNVPGITREHIASHLQKYRKFIKKVAIEIDEIYNRSCQPRVNNIPNVHSGHETQIHGLQQVSVPFGTAQVSTGIGIEISPPNIIPAPIHAGSYNHHNNYFGGNSGHETSTYGGFQSTDDTFLFKVNNTSAPVPEAPVGNGYYNMFDPNSSRNTGWGIHYPTHDSGWSGPSLPLPNMMTNTSAVLGESSSNHSNHTGLQLPDNGFTFGVSNTLNSISEASANNQYHSGLNLDSGGNSMWMVPDHGSRLNCRISHEIPAPENDQTMFTLDELLQENEEDLQMHQQDDLLGAMIDVQDDATGYMPGFQATTAQTMEAAGSSTFQAK